MLVLATAPLRADVFTISHVKVDETAADAAQAKIKAIEAAQLLAFQRLVKRLTPSGSDGQLPQFTGGDVARMMSGMTFEDERTGPTRYIATLTISFLPDAVRTLLYQYNVPLAEEQAPSMLVLPVWKTAEKTVLWDGDNPWKEAWIKLDVQNALTPILIPIGDLTDISAISAEEALAGNEIKLEALRLRYGADKVLVAVAESPDGISINASMSGVTSYGRLDLAQTFQGEPDKIAETATAAALGFLAAMEETWKSAMAQVKTPTSQLNSITVAIPFDSLAEWNTIRSRIQQTYGVGTVQIASLSARGGIVQINYDGSVQQFTEELQANGLQLSEVGGTWVIQPN
ncbi:MAG: DUF2066 domain-containing protein [Hyphomicrobiales bacterium]